MVNIIANINANVWVVCLVAIKGFKKNIYGYGLQKKEKRKKKKKKKKETLRKKDG